MTLLMKKLAERVMAACVAHTKLDSDLGLQIRSDCHVFADVRVISTRQRMSRHSQPDRGCRETLADWNGGGQVVGTVHASQDVRRLVRAVARGLRCCQEPQAAETGLGGTYFFRSEAGAMVAIIKPCDEEPLAPNNPKVRLPHRARHALAEGAFEDLPLPMSFRKHRTRTSRDERRIQ